ncbi:hypothetical protein F1847_05825 [Thermodesulfobacterium sp. TA1]|uniref:RsbRD N-terminal domain-containing protein n=1 Tax=Thermodesulfobacterium sp. TA1 TaxID=2234087 RepID=UPI001231A214|nr:RsbRD N-terminal domain-containing protein [Thermodesulfobacterium sp. TA1]QER42282.1 hypothetical protein F1847_05825 [Thermodesulfobacterium sp. TA1]
MSEELTKFLEENQEKILKKWKSVFLNSLGEETQKYFSREVDRFQNPFGYRIEEVFEGLTRVLFGEFNWEEANYYLERLAQLVAVQEEVPSKALRMFIQLKGIIREEIGEEFLHRFGIEEFLRLEDKINALLIKGFDYFYEYRERLNKIKYDEWKRAHFLLLKRAGLVYDPMEGMPHVEAEEKINQ